MKPLIIFYDGYCVLCNFWVHKLCRWDRKDRFRFAPLHSASAQRMFKETDFSLIDSVVVWDQQVEPLVESAAVFKVLEVLGGFWNLLLLLRILPTSFLNWIYRGIAKKRYRWFGKKEDCPLPNPNFKHKFLS